MLKFVRIPDYRTRLVGTAPHPPYETKLGWLIRVDVCPLINWRSPVFKSSTVQNITRLYVLLWFYISSSRWAMLALLWDCQSPINRVISDVVCTLYGGHDNTAQRWRHVYVYDVTAVFAHLHTAHWLNGSPSMGFWYFNTTVINKLIIIVLPMAVFKKRYSKYTIYFPYCLCLR